MPLYKVSSLCWSDFEPFKAISSSCQTRWTQRFLCTLFAQNFTLITPHALYTTEDRWVCRHTNLLRNTIKV